MPQITVGVIVLLIAAYIAGARYPGLATKIGVA